MAMDVAELSCKGFELRLEGYYIGFAM